MSFRIVVKPSDQQFESTESESILTAALRQGIGLPYSCRDGMCGACKCRLLEGNVVVDPYCADALSAEQAASGLVLACKTRPQSDLIIESQQMTEASDFPTRQLSVRVDKLERMSTDVMVLQLKLPSTASMKYLAGQYIDLILRDGTRRSYSIANAPVDGSEMHTIELHIRHMKGGRFTGHVFSTMKERDILRLEGPFGSFYLRKESAKPIIFLASGTGFAPIKALIEQLRMQEKPRDVFLYWGGRRPSDLYMHDWILNQARSVSWLQYIPVISNTDICDQWVGRIGFVHSAVLQDFADLSEHQVYACGAPVVVEAARKAYLNDRRLPEKEFFADAFTTVAYS